MPNFTKYLITLSATTVILSTVALCSFCSCVSPFANTKEVAVVDSADPADMYTESFYPPFGFDDEEDDGRAYMMNVVIYDADGKVEDVYEPIVEDSNACGE